MVVTARVKKISKKNTHKPGKNNKKPEEWDIKLEVTSMDFDGGIELKGLSPTEGAMFEQDKDYTITFAKKGE